MQEKIIKTDKDRTNGQNKCPKCGSTDISLNSKTGMLRCNFCRFEFEQEKFNDVEENTSNLEGEIIASGATDVSNNANNLITLKCTSCGAEITIDAASTTQARCHWCRNILPLNKQVPNGMIPDTVLPFSVTQDEAKSIIEKFVKKKKAFALPQFKKEFTTSNVMGVYFPYMIVDANAHVKLEGQGEIETKIRPGGKNYRTKYDADVYDISREFDVAIDDLTIESSKDVLDKNTEAKTNNIINSIMPFDTENCVKWDPNYTRGYTSEKRDINIDEIKSLVKAECEDVAKYSVNDTLWLYDRGVRWDKGEINFKGMQWKTAYLPVWLYSFLETKNDKKILHYIAVNGRTKETSGSVPLSEPKLLLASFGIALLGIIAALFMQFFLEFGSLLSLWPFCAIGGIAYYIRKRDKYRNEKARHTYELETKCDVTNLIKNDKFVEKIKYVYNPKILGVNNERVSN